MRPAAVHHHGAVVALDEAIQCARESPEHWSCSLLSGHEGDHVAYCFDERTGLPEREPVASWSGAEDRREAEAEVEVERLRATNARLHRRTQEAERIANLAMAVGTGAVDGARAQLAEAWRRRCLWKERYRELARNRGLLGGGG